MKNISSRLNLTLLVVILIALTSQSIQPVLNMEQIPIYSKETSLTVTAATTYYVAKNGSDANTGGWGDPWLTINHAYTTLSAGDTCYIRVGEYHERVRSYAAAASGTAGNPITYSAYNNENATIWETTGNESAWTGTWWFTRQSHIRLSGLTFMNASSFGILMEEDGGSIHNITIDNCTFINMSDSAIKTSATTEDLIVENCTLRNICNSWYDAAAQEGISITDVDGFKVMYNNISLCYKNCIDAKSGSSDGLIYNNRIDTAHDAGGSLGGGIYVDAFASTVSNVSIYNNIIWGNKTGMQFGTEQGGSIDNISAYNNIINTSYVSFILNDGGAGASNQKDNISFYHNTLYGSAKAIQLDEPDINVTNMNITNNIFDCTKGIHTSNSYSNITLTNNLFNVGSSDWWGTNSINASPVFVDPNVDFQLTGSSRAIDTGLNVGITTDIEGTARPQDSGYDRGAYEFSGTVIPFNWWDGDWQCFKNIYISNPMDNYQIFINVTNSTGGDVNCSGNIATSDFSDIRFVHDNTTEIPYWRENYTDDTFAWFWVNNSYNDTCIQMYYDNAGATTLSDGDATFIFFDNFNEATLNATKWDVTDAGTYKITGNNYLEMKANWDNKIIKVESGYRSFTMPIIVEAHIKASTAGQDADIGTTFNGMFQGSDMVIWDTTGGGSKIVIKIGGVAASYGAGMNAAWHRANATFTSTKFQGWGDWTTIQSKSGTAGNTTGYIGVAADTDSATYKGFYNWIAVRLYASPTPTISGNGTQQTNPLEISTNITTNTTAYTQIDMEWTPGLNSTHTRIQRSTTSYPTTQNMGTNVYNSTGSAFNDSNISAYTFYYYSFFPYNSTLNYFGAYNTSYNHTGSPNPTGIGTIPYGTDLNITWTNSSYSHKTVVVRKTGSYPSTPVDGTVLYNGTNEYYNDSNVLQTYSYKLYSWNTTVGLHSSGVEVPYGALDINCYDEDTLEALTFDVLVTNEDGSQTYEAIACTNTHRIDVDDCPLGTGIGIHISATDSYNNQTEIFTGYLATQNSTTTYVQLEFPPIAKSSTNVTCWDSTGNTESYPSFILIDDVITIYPDHADEFDQINVSYRYYEYGDRWYYMDLEANSQYILNTYLPPSSLKQSYTLSIIDENNDAVKDAYIRIMRLISGAYVNISTTYSDGYGQVTVYLIPDVAYKFIISKTGYETEYSDWTPSKSETGNIFQLSFASTEPKLFTFSDIVYFNATINSTGHITVWYSDVNSNTINTSIRIYEYYNYTMVLNYTDNRTSENSFSFTASGFNTSREHAIKLSLNHSDLDYEIAWIYLHAITNKSSESDLESRFTTVFGDFDLGWVKFLIIFTPCLFILVVFGKRHTGMSIMGAGLYLGFAALFVDISHIVEYGSIASLLVIVGLATIYAKEGRESV